MKLASETQRRRVGWRLLALLGVFFLCIFAVVDLFLNVAEFDEVRPDSRIYRATRYAAHEMVGESYYGKSFASETPKIEPSGSRKARAGKAPPDGPWQRLHENGTVAVEGAYRNGKRHGEWVWRHADGTLAERETLRDGLRVGDLVRFHENGKAAAEGSYVDGNRVGPWREWHADGQLAAEEQYTDGERVGSAKYFHPNGRVSQEGTYRAGVAEGTWSTFHSNGRLALHGEYREGARDGEWLVWAEWGKVIREEHYDRGTRTKSFDWAQRRHPRDHPDLDKSMIEASVGG